MDEGISLSSAVDRWLAFQADRWVEKTTSNRRMILDRLILLAGGGIPAKDLQDGHIQDLWLAMQPGPGWARYVAGCLHGFCRWLQRRGILRVDPSMAWPRVAYDPAGAFRTVSREEEARLLAVLPLPLQRYVVLAIGTGLRRGTLYSAVWSWVDSSWILSVPASAMKQGHALQIPLSVRVQELLGERGNPEDPLIAGLPCRDDLNRHLQAAARRAGVDPEHLTSHQFRRTWVERARDAGASREEVQIMQGWASSSVLLTHYWPRVSAARSREIFERI